MSATEKFSKGQQVEMTALAFQRGVRKNTGQRVFGEVAGFSREPDCVRVRIVGQATSNTYHVDFWEPTLTPASAVSPSGTTETEQK